MLTKQAVHCLQDYDYVEEEFSSSEDDDCPRETFQQKREYFQKIGECLPLWDFTHQNTFLACPGVLVSLSGIQQIPAEAAGDVCAGV